MIADRKAALAGTAASTLLALAIFLGSQRLRAFDPALLLYAVATLGAAFGVAYRATVWLQRPPTALYFRRGWELLRRGNPAKNFLRASRLASVTLLAQRFIRGRSRLRWVIHLLLAWGTMIAVGVTFPLVFGWLQFETRADDPHVYRVMLFGFGAGEFHVESPVRYVMFNLLNLSAAMVLTGSCLSLWRRSRDAGARARQQFGADLLPLLMLLAISVTGLMLTVSMHFLAGAGYAAISLIHALTVCGWLLYIPFGKFFHAFQRPAHLAVILYREAGAAGEQARCRRCGEPFASAMHVADLKEILGFEADTCPRCKRARLGVAHAKAAGRG